MAKQAKIAAEILIEKAGRLGSRYQKPQTDDLKALDAKLSEVFSELRVPAGAK